MSAPIENVSDTSFWVAHYRAIEGGRPDALFNDPWAGRLAGDKGRDIAEKMPASKYTGWSVVVRTRIIDSFVQQAIQNGVDTVLCLGAGLDARPYRLQLPKNVHWIEVDYPHVIGFKERILANDEPQCGLERVSLDLADRPKRQALLAEISAKASKVLVLTEGVIPYLTADQVGELGDDLGTQKNFVGWIVEYFAPGMMAFIAKRNGKTMQHAPFQFDPPDWESFFAHHGWAPTQVRYLPVVAMELGRPIPTPWIFKLLKLLPGAKARFERFKRSSGYAMLTRRDTAA